MKRYTIKNYKGNLLESLTKFAKSHKGMRIVEAVEDKDELKVKTEAKKGATVKITVKPISGDFTEFSFDWPKNQDPSEEIVRILRKKGVKGEVEWEDYADGEEQGGMSCNLDYCVFDGDGYPPMYD